VPSCLDPAPQRRTVTPERGAARRRAAQIGHQRRMSLPGEHVEALRSALATLNRIAAKHPKLGLPTAPLGEAGNVVE
jgi:hypothetical protein